MRITFTSGLFAVVLGVIVGVGGPAVAEAQLVSNAHNCVGKNVALTDRLKFKSHGVKNRADVGAKIWCTPTIEPLDSHAASNGAFTRARVYVHVPAGNRDVPRALFYTSDYLEGTIMDSVSIVGQYYMTASDGGTIFEMISTEYVAGEGDVPVVNWDGYGYAPGVQITLPVGASLNGLLFDVIEPF